MVIADNGRWRIRFREVKGEESYAITNGEGRFTFYLLNKAEKIAFLKIIEQLAKKEDDDLFFLTFDASFGIWLNKDDIKFFLTSIPYSESEKIISIKSFELH